MFCHLCGPAECGSVHTSNSGEAGEGASACNLHTGHIGAAGVQGCEAVVVVDGRVRAEGVIGVQLSAVQGHSVAVADS